MCLCMSCVYLHVCVCVYVCMYVCMYVYVCVCMCVVCVGFPCFLLNISLTTIVCMIKLIGLMCFKNIIEKM